MDEVTLIVSAVVAGLTTAATDVTKMAVKDTYELFMNRLKKKVEDKEDAQEALAGVEKKPESEARQAVLKEELAEMDVERDEELIRLAQRFLAQVDREGAQSGKYNVSITGGQGFVIGDNAQVEQHFGTDPDKGA